MEFSDFWNLSIYNFFGKLVGKDEYGNKYYKNKKDKRWVIYKGEINASKITTDWYSWIHNISNNIPQEKKKNFLGKNLIKITKPERKIRLNQTKYQRKIKNLKNMKAGDLKLFFPFYFFH